MAEAPTTSPLSRLLRFCLESKLVVILVTALVVAWGVLVAPGDTLANTFQKTFRAFLVRNLTDGE